MEREKIRELLKSKLNENLYKHSLAVESVMREIAKLFNEDEEKFGIAGLVHDIDLDTTKDKPHLHSIVGSEYLKSLGFDEDIVLAVKKHNPIHGLKRETLLEKALYAADPLTGLITACALVKGKKLENVDEEFVLKRFKEKRFAEGANREQIESCKEFGLSLEQFVELGLKAMKGINKDLGL
ncbi:MAG: HD domain-containing protein [Caldisericum exile]|uniref:HD domain-containing protein n=1 Tax=Caldisericum TaxID=693074 RepID=UPI0039FDAAEF